MRQRLEVLYSYDSRPAHVSEREHHHPDWHKEGYVLLKIVTDHLERLNREGWR
jgi:pterin-4a-carbinolamine dehydratase